MRGVGLLIVLVGLILVWTTYTKTTGQVVKAILS